MIGLLNFLGSVYYFFLFLIHWYLQVNPHTNCVVCLNVWQRTFSNLESLRPLIWCMMHVKCACDVITYPT